MFSGPGLWTVEKWTVNFYSSWLISQNGIFFNYYLLYLYFLVFKAYCTLFTVLFLPSCNILWSNILNTSSQLANVTLWLVLYSWVLLRLLTLPELGHLLSLFPASQTMCIQRHRLCNSSPYRKGPFIKMAFKSRITQGKRILCIKS